MIFVIIRIIKYVLSICCSIKSHNTIRSSCDKQWRICNFFVTVIKENNLIHNHQYDLILTFFKPHTASMDLLPVYLSVTFGFTEYNITKLSLLHIFVTPSNEQVAKTWRPTTRQFTSSAWLLLSEDMCSSMIYQGIVRISSAEEPSGHTYNFRSQPAARKYFSLYSYTTHQWNNNNWSYWYDMCNTWNLWTSWFCLQFPQTYTRIAIPHFHCPVMTTCDEPTPWCIESHCSDSRLLIIVRILTVNISFALHADFQTWPHEFQSRHPTHSICFLRHNWWLDETLGCITRHSEETDGWLDFCPHPQHEQPMNWVMY